jgi:hypothetical protein
MYNYGRSDMKAPINPFFEMWKNTKLHQENLNFVNLMSRPNIPPNSNVMNMTDVELIMRQNTALSNMIQQHRNSFPNDQTSVSQFFQNAQMRQNPQVRQNPMMMHRNPMQPFYDGLPQNGFVMPTQEQLQQHTSEILRAAIMRKNQQYHDEKKFQK